MLYNNISRYLKLRLFMPFIKYVRKGICPKKLALTITLGLTFGFIPFIGINTVILFILAVIFKLNHVIIQLVNYSIYPLQLILYLPFLKLGQVIFNGPKIELTTGEFIRTLRYHWLDTVIDIWQINLMGILLWVIISVPIGFCIYYFSYFILKKYKVNLN